MSPAQYAIRWVALLLLLVAVAFIAAVVSGIFDPRPCGPLVNSTMPGLLALDGRGEKLARQIEPFAGRPSCYTVRLAAAHTAGEMDSGYGLAVGDRNTALVVAVSPLGEVAVWQAADGQSEPHYLMPWQPWPHVYSRAATNEIWLEVQRKDEMMVVTARLNRELLWEGEVEPLYPGALLWLGSFGGPVTVDFQTLDWFLAPPT